MNEVIIYFILLIVIIIIYNNFKNDKVTYINNNKVNNKKLIINNISNTDDNETYHKEFITILETPIPSLRGYIDDYRIDHLNEEGGSKPFKNFSIDDDNLTVNQVNYKVYESYRKKPFTMKNI